MTPLPESSQNQAEQLRDHWWWRPGWAVGKRFYTWHLTFDGQPALHRLVDAYQRQLAGLPGLDLIPRRWLHLTMQGVGFIDEITRDQVSEVARSAQEPLAGLGPATVTFLRAAIRPEAIALPPHPLETVVRIRQTIRLSIAEVMGPEAVPEAEDGFQPHISIAYSNAAGRVAPIAEALAATAPEPASVTLDRVALIQLHRDNRMYEWQTVRQVALST